MNRILIMKRAAVILVLLCAHCLGLAQVSRTLGTIPPGGTVTITFDVSINSPFPANTSTVTNQGSITGTGFGPILTDDPNTALPNDPTITAISVAPQITCPADIVTNGVNVCALPSIPFAATVNAGVPAPTVTYRIGSTVISSPYVFPLGTNLVTVTATNGTTPDATCSFQVTVTGASPALSIARAGTNVVLSWPALFTCFTPEYASSLADTPVVWTPIPGPYTSAGGLLYLTNGTSSSNLFFRLKY